MAPEMSQSESYNNKVDIWALGILLYEMLHGRPPFFSGGIFDRFAEFEQGSLGFSPEISPAARALIASILQIDPETRPCVMEILKSTWFSENIGCKLRVGNSLVHAEMGEGVVVGTQGHVCTVEFARNRLEIADTEAIRLCKVRQGVSAVAKSQDIRNKPPLARAGAERLARRVTVKVASARELRQKSPVFQKRKSVMNTSVESLFLKKKEKEDGIMERSYDNINDISVSPVRERRLEEA